MNCQDAKVLLREFVDDELARPTRAVLERHLDSCPACDAKLRTVNAVTRALGSAGHREAPASLLPRLRAAVASAPLPSPEPPVAFISRSWSYLLQRPAVAISLIVALTACGYTVLDRVMELNRSGRWREAAAAGEKLAAAPTASDTERCGAMISAAYAHLRLRAVDAARRQLKAYDAACAGLGPEEWSSTERAKLEAEVTPGTPDFELNLSLELIRAGRWKEAAGGYAAVAERRDATQEHRCEAHTGLAFAKRRLGDRSAADDAAGRFDRDCAALPDGHWLRSERLRLGEELKRAAKK